MTLIYINGIINEVDKRCMGGNISFVKLIVSC